MELPLNANSSCNVGKMSYVQGKWIILHTSHLQNSVLKTSSILSSAFSLHSDESTYSSSPVATCLFCSFKCFECLSSQLSQHTLDPKIHHKILNSVLPIFENLKGHKSYHGVGVRLRCYKLADIDRLTHFKVSTHCTQLGTGWSQSVIIWHKAILFFSLQQRIS